MVQSDDENLGLIESQESVDLINREFYSRFPYPWQPQSFPRLEDDRFETVMLNQSIGDWSDSRIPQCANIWVAGCGTNQAIYTALRFPQATIIGSDISTRSLEICARNAAAIGISNLILRNESLNLVEYEEEFDYVLSTGVVQCNANPKNVLTNIARSLKKKGVLELMVLNRYHRTPFTAFQKAVRLISAASGGASFDEELEIAKLLIAAPLEALSSLAHLRKCPEAMLADELLQPVEYSYTVESLRELMAECDLDFILPCCNQFDLAKGVVSWELHFGDAGLQSRVDCLADSARWQLTNLLLREHSPMLWFFVERTKGNRGDHYESCVREEFLDRRFIRTSTSRRNYVRRPNQEFTLSPCSVTYPAPPDKPQIRDIVRCADGSRTMREILKSLNIDSADHTTVTDIRIQTTTSLCPYLRAVSG